MSSEDQHDRPITLESATERRASTRGVTRRRLLATGAAAATAGVAGCTFGAGPLETERSTNVYSLPADTAIDISNVNGDVVVEPRPESDDVEVAIVKRTRGSRDRFDRASVVSAVEDGTLELETDYKDGLTPERVSVDLTVRIPDGYPLVAAATGNGDVTVSDVAGNAALRSANGDVTASGVDGYPKLETANGEVEATGGLGLAGARSANGDVDVELWTLFEDVTCASGNGNVDIGVPNYLPADVELSVGNGEITVEGLDMQNRSDMEDRVTGRLVEAGHELTCKSGNGDVRLYDLFE